MKPFLFVLSFPQFSKLIFLKFPMQIVDIPRKGGKGVVATRRFEKGEFVVEYAGKLLNPAAAKEQSDEYNDEDPLGMAYMYYFPFQGQQYW